MKKILFTVLVIVIGGGITFGTGYLVNYLQIYQQPETAQAAGGAASQGSGTKQVKVSLSVFPDSPAIHPEWEAEHGFQLVRTDAPAVNGLHTDWVTYGPTTNLQVPAHSTVTMTIYNYDGGESLLNDFYSQVRGTVGGTMQVDGETTSQIPPNTLGHTFTIHGIPSAQQPWLFVSIPLRAVPDDQVNAGDDHGYTPSPTVTTFSFQVGDPGTYVWQCEYPCGTSFDNFGGPMSMNGYMNGTFDVVA